LYRGDLQIVDVVDGDDDNYVVVVVDVAVAAAREG